MLAGGDDELGLDRRRCGNRLVCCAGRPEERDADQTLGRVMAYEVANAPKAGICERRGPLLRPLVALARVDCGCNTKGKRRALSAVGQADVFRDVEFRERAILDVAFGDDPRIAEDFDEVAEGVFGEVAGATRRLEIESAGPVVREPPRVKLATMNSEEILRCPQLVARKVCTLGGRTTKRAQCASRAALRRAASTTRSESRSRRSHVAGVTLPSSRCGVVNHEAIVYGLTPASSNAARIVGMAS